MSEHRRASSEQSRPWWGEYPLADGERLELSLGALRAAVFCLGEEWQVFSAIAAEPDAKAGLQLATRTGAPAADAYAAAERFLFTRARERLHLGPRLADRPVVSRPVMPFQLAAGEETIIFVSSPVWVAIGTAAPATPLLELPSQRLSDTWFGPSTQEGELCYASSTSARRFLHELSARAHRAVTPVQINNYASTPLRLDRISLPTPFLSLYGDARGALWTQAITLLREEGSELATLKMEETPPREAEAATLVSGPRRSAGKGILVRAFGALFN